MADLEIDRIINRVELGVGALKMLQDYREQHRNSDDARVKANLAVIDRKLPELQKLVLQQLSALGIPVFGQKPKTPKEQPTEVNVKTQVQAQKNNNSFLSSLYRKTLQITK